jgi:hypothetical protein
MNSGPDLLTQMTKPMIQAAQPTPQVMAEAQQMHEIPEILQIVATSGWWIERPEIDEATGAVMTNRMRAIAFALCRTSNGVEIRPIDDAGRLATCDNLAHEADAGMITKYKKRARTPAPHAAGGQQISLDGLATESASGAPVEFEPEEPVLQSRSGKPDEHRLRNLKSSLYEGLQWVSAILDKDPGDELLRGTRQQLRWMQSAVDNQRRPTVNELGQLTLTAEIVPQIKADDPYLAQMLTEIESIYRDL